MRASSIGNPSSSSSNSAVGRAFELSLLGTSGVLSGRDPNRLPPDSIRRRSNRAADVRSQCRAFARLVLSYSRDLSSNNALTLVVEP